MVVQPAVAGVEVLLTVREVAKVLGVCTAVVYALVSAEELGHVRVSNSIRIPRWSIEAYLASARTSRSARRRF